MNELAELVYQVTSAHASLDAEALGLILDQLHHFSTVEVQAILTLLDSAAAVERLHHAQDLFQSISLGGGNWHCFPPLDPCPV